MNSRLPQPSSLTAAYRALEDAGGYQPHAHINPARPIQLIRPGLQITRHVNGKPEVCLLIAIRGDQCYFRKVFSPPSVRHWIPLGQRSRRVCAIRCNPVRRWPVFETPYAVNRGTVAGWMAEGRWMLGKAPAVRVGELAFIDVAGESGMAFSWPGAGNVVCRWQRSSRKRRSGKEDYR